MVRKMNILEQFKTDIKMYLETIYKGKSWKNGLRCSLQCFSIIYFSFSFYIPLTCLAICTPDNNNNNKDKSYCQLLQTKNQGKSHVIKY